VLGLDSRDGASRAEDRIRLTWDQGAELANTRG
jgi:hypothetical protein